MHASDLIAEYIPALSPTSSIQEGLELMEEYKVLHLPVVDEKQYKGVVHEDQLLEAFNPHEAVSLLHLKYPECFVYEHQHLYEVLKKLAENQLTIIPVLNKVDEFNGLITARDLLFEIGNSTGIQLKGAIVEILVNNKQFSLADLARIVESNGGHIIDFAIDQLENEPTQLLVTIKLAEGEVTRVISALERFEYVITSKYLEPFTKDESYRNLEHFFKFLDI